MKSVCGRCPERMAQGPLYLHREGSTRPSLGSTYQPALPRATTGGHRRPPKRTRSARRVPEQPRGALHSFPRPEPQLPAGLCALAGWVTQLGTSRPSQAALASGLSQA